MAPEQALVLSGELRREHGALGNCLDPRARRHLARTRRALEPAISYDSGSEAQKEPQCEEEEEVDEVAFVRRHAPLELMEKHGYAAHPSIAKLMGGASVAATSTNRACEPRGR